MNWGMMLSGECLTLKTSECPKTEKEYSLSDILEEHVPEKYFLSETVAKRLRESIKQQIPLQQDTAMHSEAEVILLKIGKR